jgi:CTP:phosphocholine cytidylyltransferase-like protein
VDKSNKDILAQNKYRLYSKSGNFPHTFGFLLSCYILGGDEMIQRNLPFLKGKFSAYLNFDDPQWVAKAKELGEEEKVWLDAHKRYSFEQLLEQKPWMNQVN